MLRRTLATIPAAHIPGQISEVVVVGSGNIRAALACLGLPVSVHAWVRVAVAQEDAGVRADREAEGIDREMEGFSHGADASLRA